MKHMVSVCALNNLGAPLADLIAEFSRADFDCISIHQLRLAEPNEVVEYIQATTKEKS